jgi:hypothetical protein
VSKGPGTEQCLDRPSLARAVEARLRRQVFRADVPVTLHVKISIAHAGGSWSALLTMHDGAGAFLGRRSLVTEAADCSALDDSLALVVALLVESPPPPEPEAPAPASEVKPPVLEAKAPVSEAPAPAANAPAKAAPSPEPLAIHLPPDTPAPREPWRLQLAAEGSGAIGMLPGFAPGIELGFGAKGPTLPEMRLFAGWYAQREQRRSEPDAGARFDVGYLGLEVCPLERELGISRWFVCAGQSLGRLRVEAFGFDQNLTSTHLTYALLVRGGVQLGLGSRWAARLGVRAELPLVRGVFSYGTREGAEQDLFRASSVAAVLDFGLVVRL